jgi:hypothetical protein
MFIFSIVIVGSGLEVYYNSLTGNNWSLTPGFLA